MDVREFKRKQGQDAHKAAGQPALLRPTFRSFCPEPPHSQAFHMRLPRFSWQRTLKLRGAVSAHGAELLAQSVAKQEPSLGCLTFSPFR